jgi:hypothetical protein
MVAAPRGVPEPDYPPPRRSRERAAERLGEADERTFEDVIPQIVVASLDQTAHVLVFPPDMDEATKHGAVARMREIGIAHGTFRSPNLTDAGVDLARRLAGIP